MNRARLVRWLLFVGLCLALFACTPTEAPVKFLIGVSQANLSEPWRISMTDEIRRQAGLHPDLRVIVADASDSLGKQIGDVEKFEGLGVDLLIISPLESEALTPTVTRVFQSTPVIVLNRSVANYDYTLFIGPDNARIGREAGRFVAKILRETGGEVLEVLGRSGSPPTLERAEGFRQEIARNPLIRLQTPVLANWLRDGAEDSVRDRLQADGPPRVIFAHNDSMAYGAWLAADKLKISQKITFLGVDGLPGPRGGMELLRGGILDGTFLSPTGGKEAVEYALAILRHQGEQPKKVILGTRFLTPEDSLTPSLSASPELRPRRVGFFAASGSDSWRVGLRSSAQRSLGSQGWTLVPVSGTVLPADLDAVVVDVSDVTLEGRRAGRVIEAVARARGLPLVLLGPQPASTDDSGWTLALGPDPLEEGRRAGRWLSAAGARRILTIIGSGEEAGSSERFQGLVQGASEQGSAIISGMMKTTGTRESARKTVAAALAAGVSFDAICAFSDELALGSSDALSDRPGPLKVRIAGVGGGTEVLAALQRKLLACVIRSSFDLGPLLRTELAHNLDEPGVSRRLITNHDVLTR